MVQTIIKTPLGDMVAVADTHLYSLQFIDQQGLEHKTIQLKNHAQSVIPFGITDPIKSIQQELEDYFLGLLKEFKTPLYFLGTDFQKNSWRALIAVPYGQTRSYAQQAVAIGNRLACRAVANANGANQFTIIVPCHRVISSDGTIGGYGGGVSRKKWLLNHEKSVEGS